MAESEHIKILEQGVQTWNQWRRENPTARPDLSETILGPANLSGANLQKVNLNKCYLKKANLFEANLYQANLREAYLLRANLEGAILRKANLSRACLLGVNLSKADLNLIDLSGANLSYVNLSDVRHWESIWSMQLANIYKVKKAPRAFYQWARENGAVSSTPKEWNELK